MKDFIRVFLEGIINNSKRILFASDRVTDIEMRNKIPGRKGYTHR